jgi:hypothetical protein
MTSSSRVIGPRGPSAEKCFCMGTAGLCSACVEAALTRPLLRAAQKRGERWGRKVYAKRTDGDWPHWDKDVTGRLRARAFELVRGMHDDAKVVERLARACAYHGGVAYREAKRGRREGPD